MVALIGAAVALILVSPKEDPQPILEKVEWSVLLFFASLFVIVGGMEHSGAIGILAEKMASLASGNLVVAAILIMVISAVASAAVDNIPFTMAMIPVILHLESQGVPVNILWWSLALGVGFGGNGTPIGSTANVVVVAKSEQTDDPITFMRWIKSGSVAMIATVLVAALAIALFPEWLSGPHR
jgi:Na+/H+ antiporter NhaD/arsenite permease-like protein